MRCSVVFGVTLRLLVINISSSSSAINTTAYYQRYVTTCRRYSRGPGDRVYNVWPVAALTASSQARYRLGNAISAYPTPLGGRSRRNIAVPFGMGKLEWCYTMVKKIEDMFIRFDRMHERDGHTHRMTA